MKKIICFHLLNDYSGSPIVLKSVLKGLLKRGFEVTLYTSDGGALDELIGEDRFRKVSCRYHFSRNHLITLFRFIGVQLKMALHALRYIGDKETLFYINTLLPAFPAAAARLIGKRVVYHYHENAYAKGIHYRILHAWMNLFAHEIICVSEQQRSRLHRERGVSLVYNAISRQIPTEDDTKELRQTSFQRKQILMVSGMKRYKGIAEFIHLAAQMSDYDFVLVISETMEHIQTFIRNEQLTLSSNIKVHGRQEDLSGFYQEASVCLNLSNRKLFIESFGMTIIEAMSFGVPVIIPTEGGLSRFVVDGWNGYKIDSDSLNEIKIQLKSMLTNWNLYEKLSVNARTTALSFSPEKQLNAIIDVINH